MTITITTDRSRLDIPLIHRYLSEDTYWATGRSMEKVKRSIDSSLCFGIYSENSQIGFARVVTDHVTIAHICDVFILDGHKGNGYGKKLMEHIINHEDLRDVKRWMLGTRDAHDLYRKFGFKEPEHPERWMERLVGT